MAPRGHQPRGRGPGPASQSEASLGAGDQWEEGEHPALAHHGVIPLQQNTIKYCVLPQKVRIWTLDSDYEASRGRKTKTSNSLHFCGARERETWFGSNGLSVSRGLISTLCLVSPAYPLIHFVDRIRILIRTRSFKFSTFDVPSPISAYAREYLPVENIFIL